MLLCVVYFLVLSIFHVAYPRSDKVVTQSLGVDNESRMKLKDLVEIGTRCMTQVPTALFAGCDVSYYVREESLSSINSSSRILVAQSRRPSSSIFNVVRRRLVPSIYKSWLDYKDYVLGFLRARYKSFKTLAKVECFMLAND